MKRMMLLYFLALVLVAPPAMADEITPNPPGGVDITSCAPCLTVPVDITRTDATPVRGISVTFQLSAELEFCGANIVPTYGTGSWVDGIAAASVQDFILDNGDGTWTVDRTILGAACGSTIGGSIFTVDVAKAAGVVADATGTITVLSVKVRDCVNAPIPATPGIPGNVAIIVDPPDGVTNLAAAQLKAGNDADGTTEIQLSWDAVVDPQVTNIAVYRKGFGSYPEYDDAGGSVPLAPADPTAALADGWALAADLAPATTNFADETVARDFWYYIVFTDDGCQPGPASNQTGGTLNYHLGDVAPGAGDNQLLTGDISALGAGYGSVDGGGNYDNELDVGPTADFSVDSLPVTDDLIEFEDLMVFAINHSLVSKGPPAPDPADFNEITLNVVELEQDRVDVRVFMAGDGNLQGIHIPLRWNPSALRPVGMTAGSLLAAQNRVHLVASALPGEVDAAVFGTDGSGISGTGLLAVLKFEIVGAGAYGIAPGEIVARDADNQEQPISGQVTGNDPAGHLPAVSMLHRNYPNPFNPSTTFSFTLSKGGAMRLAVYSLSGRHVATILEEEMEAGSHERRWTGLDRNGRSVSSGTYLVRLVAPDRVQSQRITLIK